MKFYLDGTLINDEPNGDIVTTIKRDSTLGGFLITNDAKLKWHGDGSAYIQSVIDSTGFCGEIDCEIWDECNGEQIRIFIGKIFILEIQKSTGNQPCIITAPVQDNNFYARINKNKSIEITIDTTRSKNAVTISAAATNAITMFKPSTGATIATTRQGYRVYDVFKNMIAFMSDDEVDFDSTYFGIGGEFEGLSLMYGQEINFAGTGTAIKSSFDKTFQEVKKKTNCTFYIDTTGAKPVLRIEKYGDLFLNSVIRTLQQINRVSFKIDSSKLISTVSVGSTIVDMADNLSFQSENFFTFLKEDYTTLGQCNIDTKLDLVSEFIISSNDIEDALPGSNTSYVTNIFFIDCETVVASGSNYTSNAIKGNPFNQATIRYYNTRLMNSEVLSRYDALFPNDIINFSGTVNNLFLADFTTTYGTLAGGVVEPFQFDDDFNSPGNDPLNNYGNGTAQGLPVSAANSRYTCPSDGNYKFRVSIFIQGIITITIRIRHYDSGGTLKNEDLITQAVNSPLTPLQIILNSVVYYALATDYAVATIYTPTIPAPLTWLIIGTTNQTFFECVSAPFSTGIVQSENTENIALIKADFEYPIVNADFYDIQSNPFQKIAFTYLNKVQSGWIDAIKYNHQTSEANITLIGTQEMLK